MTRCLAATNPSPPLFPGPQTTRTLFFFFFPVGAVVDVGGD
eukprot:CAMPEP_0203656124 /NCGR_PEP_ID=MMETSP0088-20131115/40562_1 /ASSEMBLY_ACC=CAM_ASM_001087 /TAXON_ID=426623 /ORGANISM="Chaetoceros affinis, Strain CCMP159" /LENGTH=40 /DNA_ID= /DNA_START= /DNA_END= /DNA_ORIENTATION=